MATGSLIYVVVAAMNGLNNDQVAERLSEAADLLELQDADGFRVRAYRNAAQAVRALEPEVSQVLSESGVEGLVRIPHIGRSIARAIDEMAHTGGWAYLRRLRGECSAETIFQVVPGIGPTTAAHIHETLDIDTLEGLEIAAHDGRLESVRGIGPRKAAAIRASLDSILSRRRSWPRVPVQEPTIALLLEVDRRYRAGVAAETLEKIAPKRFNPAGDAWLPILHEEVDGWVFTALFSNTARAHDLGKTHDWVVLFFHHDAEPENLRTVVTETRGPFEGRRVVRGREQDCAAYYRSIETR